MNMFFNSKNLSGCILGFLFNKPAHDIEPPFSKDPSEYKELRGGLVYCCQAQFLNREIPFF